MKPQYIYLIRTGEDIELYTNKRAAQRGWWGTYHLLESATTLRKLGLLPSQVPLEQITKVRIQAKIV